MMIQEKHRLRFFFCLSILSLLVCGSSHARQLTLPSAPFQRDKDQHLVKAEAKVVGREIVYGNKKLIIGAKGVVTCLQDSRQIFRIAFVNFRIEANESSYDPEKKQFLLSGKIPLHHPPKKPPEFKNFKLTIALLPDSRVRFLFDATLPSQYRKTIANYIHLTLSGIKEYEIDGKIHKFSEEREQYFSDYVVFAPNSPAKRFSIRLPEKTRLTTSIRKGTTGFRIYPFKRRADLEFFLDLGLAISQLETPGEKPFGGIDFKKTEDLEPPDYDTSRNLMSNPSFEQGTMFCNQMGYRNAFRGINLIKADRGEAKFGLHSLLIKGRTPWISFSPVPAEKGEYTFSFYAKGEEPKSSRVKLRINKNLNNIRTKTFIVSKDWRRHEISFEMKNLGPLAFQIMVDGKNPKAAVWIDGLQLEKGGKATDFVAPRVEGLLLTSKDDNFLQPNEKLDARLRIFTHSPEVTGKVKVTVRDFFGEVGFSKDYSFKTDHNGLAFINLPFDDEFPEGIYMVKADFTLADGYQRHDFFRFAIMPFLKNQHKIKSLFANGYSGPGNCKAVTGTGEETYLRRCRDIGVGGDTHPGNLTPEMSQLYEKYGVEPINYYVASWNRRKRSDNGHICWSIIDNQGKLLIDEYHVDPAGKLTDEYLERFEKAVTKVVKQNPWIKRWAMGGEMAGKLGPDDWESHAKLQIAFFDTVKGINSDLQVYQGSPCNIYPQGGIKNIGKLLDLINGKITYDALAIHDYIKAGPVKLESYLDALFDMAEKHGYQNTKYFFPEGMHYGPYNIPQWGIKSASWRPSSAWFAGTLSYDMGWTEKLSAAWFARSWLIMMKHMDKIISASSGVVNLHSNFCLDTKLTPRAYQKIPNTLGHLLGDSKFIADLSFASNTKCLLFEDDQNRPVAAVWSQGEKYDRGERNPPWAKANFTTDTPEIIDLMGDTRQVVKDDAGNVRFPVSPFPFFIRGRAGETSEYVEILKSATLENVNSAPLAMTAKINSVDTVELTLTNQIARTVKGQLHSRDLVRELNLAPHEKIAVELKMSHPLTADKIAVEEIPVQIDEDGTEQAHDSISFRGFCCRKTLTPIKVDGNDNDWSSIPAVDMNNRHMGKTVELEKGDFEGSFKIAWDRNFLYLLVKVKDDFFFHAPHEKIGNRWRNDSLQVYFDTKCDARQRSFTGFDDNDYDYAVFPEESGEKATVFRYRSPDMQHTLGTSAPPDNTVEPNIFAVFKKTADGYIYEVAFPAKFLLPINLEDNYVLGFSLFVNDRDQGDNVDQSLTLTPPGTSGYRNPHLYPAMILVE